MAVSFDRGLCEGWYRLGLVLPQGNRFDELRGALVHSRSREYFPYQLEVIVLDDDEPRGVLRVRKKLHEEDCKSPEYDHLIVTYDGSDLRKWVLAYPTKEGLGDVDYRKCTDILPEDLSLVGRELNLVDPDLGTLMDRIASSQETNIRWLNPYDIQIASVRKTLEEQELSQMPCLLYTRAIGSETPKIDGMVVKEAIERKVRKSKRNPKGIAKIFEYRFYLL